MKSVTANRYLQEHLNKVNPQPKPVEKVVEKLPPPSRVSKFQPIWTEEIEQLKAFFKTENLSKPIKLNAHSTIYRPSEFVDTHLGIIEANNGNLRFKIYLERLQQLKSILTP